MKTALHLVAILLLFSYCSTQKDYNIECQIEGLQSDSALIAFTPESDRDKDIIDTVRFVDGKLKYNFPADELYEAWIIPFDLMYKFENGKSYTLPASRIHFFIDSLDHITIHGVIADRCIDYEATGNLLSRQLTEARKMTLPLLKERVTFEFAYNSKNSGGMDENSYLQLTNKNYGKYERQSISYIKSHPNAEYSARLLLEFGDKEKEKVIALYSGLTEKTKRSHFGRKVGNKVSGWRHDKPGTQFPNIVDHTLTGKEFELNNCKGKYVLLDFWGSWCGPCLGEMPELKKINEKYRDKLEIVGIACRDNRTRLIKTIESNKIPWTQILEGSTPEAKYSDRFGITGYPTKFLLDKDGKVIKVYRGIDSTFYQDIEKLFSS